MRTANAVDPLRSPSAMNQPSAMAWAPTHAAATMDGVASVMPTVTALAVWITPPEVNSGIFHFVNIGFTCI